MNDGLGVNAQLRSKRAGVLLVGRWWWGGRTLYLFGNAMGGIACRLCAALDAARCSLRSTLNAAGSRFCAALDPACCSFCAALDPACCSFCAALDAACCSLCAALDSACSRFCAVLNGFFHLDGHAGRSTGRRLGWFSGVDPGAAQHYERCDEQRCFVKYQVHGRQGLGFQSIIVAQKPVRIVRRFETRTRRW